METNKVIIFGIYIVLALYLLYKLLLRRYPYKEEYEKLYNEILNSEKYKVKGQYDREE